MTFVLVKLGDVERALAAARDLAEKEGIQELELYTGWGNDHLAKFRQAVGEKVPIFVCRGNVPNSMMVAQILMKEGWFPEKH